LPEVKVSPKDARSTKSFSKSRLATTDAPNVATATLSLSVKKPRIGKSEDKELIPIPDLLPAPNLHFGMQYFIPEWDDRVDPGYDFLNDAITPGRDPYKDDIYAHQIYSEPNYNGILVSKGIVERSKKKKVQIEEVGIRNFIRFSLEVMGDCGAFGYIKEEVPPYNTEEILEYYQRIGFDYGVSIDHLIVGPFAESGVREKRYELTIKNAEEFIQKHQAGGYTFIPIGAVQGWSPDSYAKAVKAYIRPLAKVVSGVIWGLKLCDR
jgi:hypothetical protein